MPSLVSTAQQPTSTLGRSKKLDLGSSGGFTANGVNGASQALPQLAQVTRLFTNEDTKELHERQLIVLKRLILAYAGGFYIHDLLEVDALLPLISERAKAHDSNANLFGTYLLKIIKICEKPPLCSKAGEELRQPGLDYIRQLYASLGTLLAEGSPAVQIACADALTSIAAAKGNTRANLPTIVVVPGCGEVPHDLRPPPKAVAQAILQSAGVVANTMAALHVAVALELEDETAYYKDSMRDKIMELRKTAAGEMSPAGPGGDDPETDQHDPERVSDDETSTGDVYGQVLGMGPKLRLALLKLTRELCTNATSCAAMVELGLVDVLIHVLQSNSGIRDKSLQVAVEVLWNALEHSAEAMTSAPTSRGDLVRRSRRANATFALCNETGVEALKSTLDNLLAQGYWTRDKELRNEVLILISFVAQHPKSFTHFQSTGLLQLLLRYATAVETGLADGNPRAVFADAERSQNLLPLADPNHFATNHPVDLEFKQLLWTAISDLSQQGADAMSAISSSSLMETLVMYLDLVVEEGPESTRKSINIKRSISLASTHALDASGAPTWGTLTSQHALQNTGGEEAVLFFPPPPLSPQGSVVAAQTQGMSYGSRLSQLYIPAFIAHTPRTAIRVLQCQAVNALLFLAPHCSEGFHAMDGHIVTLRFLERCSSSNIGDDGPKMAKSAVMLLAAIVGMPKLQEDLGRLDAVRTMLGRFNRKGDPDMRTSVVSVLTHLCAGSESSQDAFRNADGIPSMVLCLEEYCKQRSRAAQAAKLQQEQHPSAVVTAPSYGSGDVENSLDHVNALVVHVVDCLWRVVIGNRKSEGRLLQCEGLDVLLDLLEVCPLALRHQTAGIIGDLLKNKRAKPYALAWRSDGYMRTLAQLLMQLWVEEENRLGVTRPDGVLLDLIEPLQNPNKASAASGGASSETNSKAPGKIDPGRSRETALRKSVENLDLRAKIHAIVMQVFHEERSSGLLGSSAFEGLNPKEAMSMLMALSYHGFREGEAWRAVASQLKAANIKPIGADARVLTLHIEGALHLAVSVREKQLALLQQGVNAAAEAESQLFALILHQRDQELKQAKLVHTSAATGAFRRKMESKRAALAKSAPAVAV